MPAPSPLVPDTARRDWTLEEVHALPDDGHRYELIDGELFVTPSPSARHQDVVAELLVRVKPYGDALQLHTYIAPTAVRFSNRREVQPDLLVLPTLEGRRVLDFADVGKLALAVEVVSPSSVRADRYVKQRLFQSERVPEYWIIDPLARTVERWRLGDDVPEVLLETLTWQPAPDAPPLVLDLGALFRAVHGE